ncbi:true, partial [Symbiodinium sp. CCMP2592]
LVTQEAQLLQLQASGLGARGRQSTFDTDMPGPSQPPAPRAGLVDTRQLGKPEVFKGSTEESFSDWSFIFESYLSCIDSRYIDLLEQAKFSKKSFPNRALSDVDRDLSCQLYYILVMLLRGRPLDITYNTGLGEGLESYRRIFEEFHPRVASRYVGTLTTLLSSKFGDDVEGDLAAFEKSVRRYEQESGKTLDEEMLLGIVVNGLKDSSLQSHIIRNSSRLKSFTDVKAELLEISRTNRVLQSRTFALVDGLLPILVIVDEKSGCVFSGVVAKGVNPYATGLVTEALKFCGRQKVIMMSDAEHSIRALAESAAKSWTGSVQHQTAPKGSHASNGAAERAILELARQVRTLASALEERYKKPLETEGVVFPWLVRHAGWLISRFLVKQDGRTPYERLRGRDFRGEVAECCEVVHYKLDKEKTGKLDKQTSVGVWLGKSLASDEHFLGTPQGHGKTPGCPGCECDDDNPKRNAWYTSAGPMETEGGQAEMPQGTGQDLESGSTEPSQPSRPRAMEGTSEAKSGQKREVEDAGVPAPSSDSGQRRVTGKSSQGAKKQKTPEARGEKRPLEDQELMGGLPTLHEKGEWEPLFAYPLDGRVEELGAYDERTGQPLPVDKVKTARGRELDKMEEHSEEARRQGLKIVRSRWVDGWKPLPNDPNGVRSRCVAQEINDHERDDVFSGTPPLRTHRMVLSAAATAKPGRTNRRKRISRYDVSVAFFHAVATGKIAVVPPKDLDQSKLWYLLKAMNGTREVSRQWSKRVCEVMTEAGFWEVPGIPDLFYHDEWCVTLSCHGDDFIAEGESDDLDRLDALMMQSFESKILPRIGPEEFGGQTTHGDHLHRIIRWSERGFTWEADPKYSRQIVEDLGLADAKGADAPCSTECGKGRRDLEDPLDTEAAAKFRRLAGTALYLSQDRPTIQYALSEITSGMAKPTVTTVEHELKLKHLGRYLLKYPKEVWHYEYQEQPEEAVVLADSDWGACKRTRKSMSSYAERFGKHLIDASCAKQSVIALSSGEAEFYALVRGAAAGLLTAQIWERIGSLP